MGLELVYEHGQTPLSDDEKEGLLQKHIMTQGDLNEAEQLNIEEAIQWTLQKRFSTTDILSESFVRDLHKRMYKHVWRWAGQFRYSDKNIGIDWKQVPLELRQLADDCNYWISHNTFDADETAIRFKHKIVSIHCFPNGNGRHSRLMADLIASKIFGNPIFNWGGATLIDAGASRKKYIEALQAADRGEFSKLVAFSRS